MRISCSICTELYEYTSEISALQCGHTYHRGCLEEWLRTGGTRSCPQCRARVSPNHMISRIFLDKADEAENVDPGELKNQLETIRLRLGEKDQAKKDLQEIVNKRDKTIENLQGTVGKIEAMYKEEQITCKSLRKQLEYFKSQQREAQQAKEEARTIRTYMHNLKNVETVVKGVESEVESLVNQSGDGPAAVKQLSTYCVVLKRELEMLKESKKKLRDNVDHQKKQIGTQQRELNFKSERIKQLELLMKKVRVPETPNTPCTPAYAGHKPKLSHNDSSLDDLIAAGRNIGDESPPPQGLTNSAKRKADCEEFGMHYIKIKTAASSGVPAKRLRSEPLQDVATPQHFNILKNMRSKNSSDQPSVVRTGYNGLGTHTKFLKMSPPKVRTVGKGLMKQKGKQSSLSSFFPG